MKKQSFGLEKKAAYFIRLLYMHQRLGSMIYLIHTRVQQHVCKSKNKPFIWERTFPCFSFSLSLLGHFCQASVSVKAVQSRVQRKEIHLKYLS